MGLILTVNAGSSSLKLALFGEAAAPVATASVSEIGGASRLRIGSGESLPCEAADHGAAFGVLHRALAEAGHDIARASAAGHRVVHGGALNAACRITDETLAAIEAAVPLAPLHNPANLAGIRALSALAPDLPQTASLDTAFHATNPEEARRYAIPASEEARGIRRYGFHGISYAALVAGYREATGAALPARLLALHLGNGASLCAIRDGRSVATTMGYSPTGGLTMGTRSGGIDPMAVLRLARIHGIDGAARMLDRESGLLGLGGASDLRALRATGTDAAAFAISHFAYWTIRNAGSMIAAMGGTDGLVFTGGIGENDHQMRAAIMDGLAFTGLIRDTEANRRGGPRLHGAASPVSAFVMAAAEEAEIARECRAILGLGACG